MAKFIGELREAVARGEITKEEADRQMNDHVFGVGHQKDARGRPIEQGRGSTAQLTSGRHPDSTERHLAGILKNDGTDAEAKERKRIKAKVSEPADI